MLRVLREWDLTRPAPARPLARACALHLLCRDAGLLHDAGMFCWLGCMCDRCCCLRVCACACFANGYRPFRSRKPARACLLYSTFTDPPVFSHPVLSCHCA